MRCLFVLDCVLDLLCIWGGLWGCGGLSWGLGCGVCVDMFCEWIGVWLVCLALVDWFFVWLVCYGFLLVVKGRVEEYRFGVYQERFIT